MPNFQVSDVAHFPVTDEDGWCMGWLYQDEKNLWQIQTAFNLLDSPGFTTKEEAVTCLEEYEKKFKEED